MTLQEGSYDEFEAGLCAASKRKHGCNGLRIGCNFCSVSSSDYRMEISMFSSFAMRNSMVALLIAFAATTGCSAAARAPIPPPAGDAALAQSSGSRPLVFAGGCFWGTQSVFERVKGVLSTTAGYSGGTASPPPTTRCPRRIPGMRSR